MLTLLITLEWPIISPTDDRVSNEKAWPNLSLPSPTAMRRLLSESQAISRTLPETGRISFFNICSSFTVSQIRTLPWASTATNLNTWNFTAPVYAYITSWCNVETTWAVPSNSRLRGVADIFPRKGWVLRNGAVLAPRYLTLVLCIHIRDLDITNKDGLAIRVYKVLAFGITAELDGLTACSLWQRCKCIF